MGNLKGVVIVFRGEKLRDIKEEDIEVYVNGRSAIEDNGKNYHTMKKKWEKNELIFGEIKILRKNIKRIKK
jgi:hypothetical protein